VKAHRRDDETVFGTLRRLTREPDPAAVAEILSDGEVEAARSAAERFGGRHDERFERAPEASEEWSPARRISST
jgi:hypothetical protein